ncbi:hypothetical protein [Stigmatella erecta]|uniref:hypothetical protein n=1 Tax=Stigmatella erecta TaxID=83460 RepID=UPI000B80FAAC|nr:hypothetical protein [Stigmatella erecta]
MGTKGGPPRTAHPGTLEAEQKYLAAVRKQLADVAGCLAMKLVKLEPGNPMAAQLQLRLEILQRFDEKLGARPEDVSVKAH